MSARSQDPEHWRSYLAELPPADPPPALRARVLQAWPQATPAWRRRPLWALAAAAAVAALGLRVALAPDPLQPPPLQDPVLVSQQLEQQLLDSPAAADPQLRAGIAEIDRVLGAAYRRGAGGEELEALWRARAEALQQGLTAAPPVPARI